jgi:hypothetical protein
MSGRRKKSKKPSGTKAEQLLEQAVWFTDECLGQRVPAALRAAGMTIEPWYDHFPAGTLDEIWLPEVGARGWIVLTKDKAIRRKPWEMGKVIAAGVRMFTLPSGNMTGDQMAALFLDNRLDMGRCLKKNRGPLIAVVSQSGVTLVRSGSAT